WPGRRAEIRARAAAGPRAGQAIRQRHAMELAIERLRTPLRRLLSPAEVLLLDMIAETVRQAKQLAPAGRIRLTEALQAAITGEATLIPLLHLMRTAALQRSR